LRPRTKVLLLMSNEEEVGLWRFRLEVGGRFAVLAATEPMTALELVAEYPDCRIAAAISIDSIAILRMAPQLDSLLLFGVKAVTPCLAHRVIVDTGKDHVGAVREALREMVQRKRGPARRSVRFEGSPSLYALLEERDVGKRAA